MNQVLRKSLENLANHSDDILETIISEWPESERVSSPMERSDRHHLLAAIRQLGIVARRSARRTSETVEVVPSVLVTKPDK